MQRAATSTQPEHIFVDIFREVFGLQKAQPGAVPAKWTAPSKESNPSQLRRRGHEMSR